MAIVDAGVFESAAEIARSICEAELSGFRSRSHRYGTKVWLGGDEVPRLHFEAQVMARKHIDGVKGMAVEIGFHAEDRSEAVNQEALDRLLSAEKRWRKKLGPEAEAGVFFNADKWRRLSEVWIEPDLFEPDVDQEIGLRLGDYLLALAPLLRE